MTRICYPGSFDPPTIAHLAIADHARRAVEATEVVWVISRVALAKEHVQVPTLDQRLEVLRAVTDEHEWLSVDVTEHQLLADLAAGYDAVIMGADKWHQIHELRFYTDAAERDAAVASLPRPLIVPRGDLPVPHDHRLDVGDAHHVSSTAARAGRRELMLDAARRFDELTGAWTGRDGSATTTG